jgi:multiple sugar transport system substrate-binding protein
MRRRETDVVDLVQAAQGSAGRPRVRHNALVIAMALGLVLAACRAAPGTDEESVPAGAGAPSAPASVEAAVLEPPANEVTLRYWTPFTGPDGPFMQDLVDQFNAEGTTITVEMETLPDYYTEVNTAAQAGNLPEVGIMHLDQIPLNAENALITPVADLTAALELTGDDFTEDVWNGTFWKGEQYSIPMDIHPFSMYWNKAAFEEAGLDPETPPEGEEGLRETLQALIDAGYDGPVWSNHGFGAGNTWASLFYQAGGQWTNEEFSEALWNDEAGLRALEYMKGLVDDGLHPAQVEIDAEINAFLNGESALIFTGPWQTTRLAEALGEDLGAGPFPQIFGEGVWAGSHTLAVFEGVSDEERQAAYYFINWLTEHALEWAGAGMPAARASVRESAEFQEVQYIGPIAEQLPAARFFPPIPEGFNLLYGEGGANEAVISVLVGDQEAQAALDASVERYTQILTELKEEYGY